MKSVLVGVVVVLTYLVLNEVIVQFISRDYTV